MIAAITLSVRMHQLSDHRIDTGATTGKIIDGGSCGKRSNTPARVIYSVGGHTYTTTTGDRCLTVGDDITVHYQPSDPAQSDFQTTAILNGLVAAALGGLCIATGAAIAMVAFRPRGRWAHHGRWHHD